MNCAAKVLRRSPDTLHDQTQNDYFCQVKWVLAFLFFGSSLFGQNDSAIAFPLFSIHFSLQVPMGDMADRFGSSSTVGGSFMYKTQKNFLFSVESFYLFGSTVKQRVLEPLYNDDGFITDNEGYPASLKINERGVGIHFTAGKIFPVTKTNLNSGVMLTLGAGYLRHKVNIYDGSQRVAAVAGDLKKGYDHLSDGMSFSQFVGYMYLGRNRLANFYGGFEFYEAFTKSKRGISYGDASPDKDPRTDILMGIRFGWIMPLYKRTPAEFYTY